MTYRLQWLYAITLLLSATSFTHAQLITSTEVERGLRFPGTQPYGGEPYTQRYSYGLNTTNVYLNGNAKQLMYLDYLDRADRAQKFGYRMPIDPFFEEGPPVQVAPPPPVRVYFGVGMGYWRRR